LINYHHSGDVNLKTLLASLRGHSSPLFEHVAGVSRRRFKNLVILVPAGGSESTCAGTNFCLHGIRDMKCEGRAKPASDDEKIQLILNILDAV
jgi:hypothetical protein